MKKRIVTILLLIFLASLLLLFKGDGYSVFALSDEETDISDLQIFTIIDENEDDIFLNIKDNEDVNNGIKNDFTYGIGYRLIPINADIKSSGITVELYYENQRFIYKDEYIPPNNHIDADEIYIRKINASYQKKQEIMDRCIKMGGSYKNAILYTMPLLENTVTKAIQSINEEPKNSTMQFNPDQKPMFVIKRERYGKKVDEESLYRQIYLALALNKNIKVQIVPKTVMPLVTAKENSEATKLKSRHSTFFKNSNENRKHNIELALKKISGTVLSPGEEFSFNKTVGNRSIKNGFKESVIITGGKYTSGVGGGVCQVSTTLYNAALLAGQKITNAKNHSLECNYELPSFDAMVNIGSQDLCFKNTDDSSVFIRSYVKNDEAIIEFYGKPNKYVIKRHSEVIYRKEPPPYTVIVDNDYKYHDKEATPGEKKYVSYSHGEMKSAGYLLYYDKRGLLVKKEKIREDKYKAVEGLLVIAP